jgi:hypothetical protein
MSKYSILISIADRSGTKYLKATVITLENNKPRNISSDYDAKPNQYYENLCLQGHFYDIDRGICSHGIQYVDVLSVDYIKANCMAKTLKAISTRIAKMENSRVSVKSTFEQEVLDFAMAIKAQFIVTYDNKNTSTDYDDSTYKLNSLQHGAYVVSDIIDTILNNAA